MTTPSSSLSDLRDALAWPAEPFLQRANVCRVWLLLHDLLTEAESRKVKDRMLKMAKKKGRKKT